MAGDRSGGELLKNTALKGFIERPLALAGGHCFFDGVDEL